MRTAVVAPVRRRASGSRSPVRPGGHGRRMRVGRQQSRKCKGLVRLQLHGGHPVSHDVVVDLLIGGDLDQFDAFPCPSRRAAPPNSSGAAGSARPRPGSARSRDRAGSGQSRADAHPRSWRCAASCGLSSGRHSHSPPPVCICRPSLSCTSGEVIELTRAVLAVQEHRGHRRHAKLVHASCADRASP